jgi:hypothetical protein
MNRVNVIILVMAAAGIWACDTPSNITPINESFFVKLYAGVGEGNQEAIDIIATTDGGLLIAGTSIDETSNTSEIILIKTDERGNEVWTHGASSTFNIIANSEAKSVLELPDGYLIGGTIEVPSLNITRSILIKTDFNGNFLQSTEIITEESGFEHYNNLSKITRTHSNIVVSGETGHPSTQGLMRNGFIGLYNTSLLPVPIGLDTIKIFGLELDDFVTGAFEVEDTTTISANGGTRYLAFGNSFDLLTGDRTFYYVGFRDDYEILKDIGFTRISGGGLQVSNYVARNKDTYWMIGETDQPGPQMFLVGWSHSAGSNDWNVTGGSNEVGNSTNVEGKGVAVIAENSYVIVGDINFNAGLTSEIHLSKVDNFRDIRDPWPKTYGTATSTYSASAVTTLADGSIIIVGTADLEPIKKIIVIKTGPNGEMSF